MQTLITNLGGTETTLLTIFTVLFVKYTQQIDLETQT